MCAFSSHCRPCPPSLRQLFLEEPEYFNRLFEVLSDRSVSDAVWALLSLLPRSPALVDELRVLGPSIEARWPSLLDHASSYRMLYTLQVLNDFTLGAESVFGSGPEAFEAVRGGG